MKVLVIIPEFPLNLENIQGGVSSALSNLLYGFSHSDITVTVVSFNRNIKKLIVINYSPNIEINYVPEGKFPHVFNFLFKGSFVIKKYIRQFNPDIVHYAMSGYILLTKVFGLSGKVYLVTVHGIAFLEAKQKKELKQKLVCYTNGIVEKLLCPKNIIHISKYSLSLFNKKKDIITIIPNAIHPGYFKLPLKIVTNNKLVFVGGIEANKNILYLLKTLKVLVQKNFLFSLDVLGDYIDAAYKQEVISFIQENKLEKYITFHGWVNQQRLQQVLTQSDILIVCSKQETLPMVIAEAMSAGKVVVCSTAGGIPEMVNHQNNGYLYANVEVENLVSILENLYNNNTLVQKIQSRAREKAMAAYCSSEVAQKTISFYKLLLQS
jgi:glycosyltransferase involved in cell wall biosynthesis